MAENLKLQKTVKIEDTEYDINAVYSDEAGKVSQPLIIKRSLATDVDTKKFNGSRNPAETTITEINYVPATGGKFSNKVYFDKVYAADNSEVEAKSVINSSQINARITNLDGAPLYTWNAAGDHQMQSLFYKDKEDNLDKAYRLNTVVGTTSSFDSFRKLIGNGSHGLRFTLHDIVNNDYTNSWCEVSGYTGSDIDVVIPHIYTYTDDYGYTYEIPVRRVKASAFSVYGTTPNNTNSNIESVFIPNSVTTIEQAAFIGCSKLQSVMIPDSVTIIGNQAFDGCRKLQTILIPSSVESLGDKAFNQCGLTSVVFTNGLKTIGATAFYQNYSLTNIVIPDSVTTIGNQAFDGCSSLTSVTIGKDVTSIGRGTFNNCINLTTVNYCGTEEDWKKITIGENNFANVTTYNYNVENTIIENNTTTAGTVAITDIRKNPFIYICRDTGDPGLNSSNAMFLKLPGTSDFIEISKGATRLNGTTEAVTNQYYTYETLAAIIAGINARLDGLGVKALPTTLPETESVIIPENLHTEVLADDFDPESVPTVEQLTAAVLQLNGNTWDMSETTANNLKAVLNDTDKDSLKAIRADLDQLEANVEYELNGGELGMAIDYSNSRIDKLEDNLDSLEAYVDDLVEGNEEFSQVNIGGHMLTQDVTEKLLSILDLIELE
jgi:hypothetical protein